jgi:hypothetical protein
MSIKHLRMNNAAQPISGSAICATHNCIVADDNMKPTYVKMYSHQRKDSRCFLYLFLGIGFLHRDIIWRGNNLRVMG